MNVAIFAALQTNDEFHEILTNISSAGFATLYIEYLFHFIYNKHKTQKHKN